MEGNTQGLAELVGNILKVPAIDKTLTKEGYGADAKVVGEKFENIATQMEKTSKASGITYDGTDSGLKSANVNDAIDEVYAFQKNGGKVGGRVDVGKYDNGYGSLNKNHSATEDKGTQLIDVSKTGDTAHIDVNASNTKWGTATFVGTDGEAKTMFHEGNKKFGSYTGIGNGNPFSVPTQGIGKLLLVYSKTSLCLVSPKGAIVITLSTGAFSWIDSAKVYYEDGILYVTTTNEAFNTLDETYYYQVI